VEPEDGSNREVVQADYTVEPVYSEDGSSNREVTMAAAIERWFRLTTQELVYSEDGSNREVVTLNLSIVRMAAIGRLNLSIVMTLNLRMAATGRG
jgi:hypothetical protein